MSTAHWVVIFLLFSKRNRALLSCHQLWRTPGQQNPWLPKLKLYTRDSQSPPLSIGALAPFHHSVPPKNSIILVSQYNVYIPQLRVETSHIYMCWQSQLSISDICMLAKPLHLYYNNFNNLSACWTSLCWPYCGDFRKINKNENENEIQLGPKRSPSRVSQSTLYKHEWTCSKDFAANDVWYVQSGFVICASLMFFTVK